MEVGTMSFIEAYGKDYGEIFEYDEAPVIAGSTGGPRNNICSSNAHKSGSSRAIATERLSSSRYPSEISMDLSDLQDALREAEDSLHSVRSDGHSSPLHKQLVSVEEDTSCKNDDDDDDDDDDEFANYRSDADEVNNCALQFDEIHDFFEQNGTSDFSSFYKFPNERQEQQDHTLKSQNDDQQKCSKKRGESEFSRSTSTSSLITSQESSSRNGFQSSNFNLNRQRKVKFEISTRLEDIQEFEKPDIEDYHKLYYTAHELQRMIDGSKAEEQGKGCVER